MRTAIAALLLAAVVGCGDGGGANDGLAGTWIIQLNPRCFGSFHFANGTDYENDVACGVDAQNADMEVELGTYTADGTNLTLSPRLATCDGNPVRVFGYTVTTDRFTLIGSDAVHVHERAQSGGGSGTGIAIRLGCWQNNGTLAPHPLDSPY